MRGIHELYVNKATRDARFADLKKRGYRNLRKSSSRNQCISPDYIMDYAGTRYPNGFGGSADTFVAALYKIEEAY